MVHTKAEGCDQVKALVEMGQILGQEGHGGSPQDLLPVFNMLRYVLGPESKDRWVCAENLQQQHIIASSLDDSRMNTTMFSFNQFQ